jgi:hypothetical protein
MKKILMVFSQYRVGERIFPIIPKLSEKYKLDCLLLYQMHSAHIWPGNDDLRKHFYNNYQSNFSRVTEISSDLDDSIRDYDLIITDDNRVSPKTNLKEIYRKKKGLMISCFHGPGEKWNNVNFFRRGHKKIFDKTLVLGKFDCLTDYCIPIGIPSNDILKEQELSQEHILLIVNFLGNRRCPFPVSFNKELIDNIDFESLSKKFDLPVVIKLKSRADEGRRQVLINTEYIKSIMPNIDYRIVVDTINIDELIYKSKLVISAPGTLAFKPIQLGIPTIIINGSNLLGHFSMCKGLVDNDKEKIRDKIDEIIDAEKDNYFIENVIEGGIDFSSTEATVKVIEDMIK